MKKETCTSSDTCSMCPKQFPCRAEIRKSIDTNHPAFNQRLLVACPAPPRSSVSNATIQPKRFPFHQENGATPFPTACWGSSRSGRLFSDRAQSLELLVSPAAADVLLAGPLTSPQVCPASVHVGKHTQITIARAIKGTVFTAGTV